MGVDKFDNFWLKNLLFWVIKCYQTVVDSLSTYLQFDNQPYPNFINTMFITAKLINSWRIIIEILYKKQIKRCKKL